MKMNLETTNGRELDLQTTNGTTATRPVTEVPALRPCEVCDWHHGPDDDCVLYTWPQMIRAQVRGFGWGLVTASTLFALAWVVMAWMRR